MADMVACLLCVWGLVFGLATVRTFFVASLLGEEKQRMLFGALFVVCIMGARGLFKRQKIGWLFGMVAVGGVLTAVWNHQVGSIAQAPATCLASIALLLLLLCFREIFLKKGSVYENHRSSQKNS